MRGLKYFVMFFGFSLFSACTYDNAEELYGEKSTCLSGEEVSFTANVKPVLEANCWSCHSTSSNKGAGAGIDLQTFSSLQAYAENGALVGSVSQDPDFTAMPLSGGKLDACDIEAIKLWVDAGAQQN